MRLPVLHTFLASFLLGGTVLSAASPAALPVLQSPGGHITVTLHMGETMAYDVLVDDRPILVKSTLSLKIDNRVLGPNARVKSVTPREYEGTVKPPIQRKSAVIREAYHELRLELEDGGALCFRAYDEGVAYRWETAFPEKEVKVLAEEAAFNFPSAFTVYYPEEQSMYSHNERHFLPRAMDDLSPKNIACLPAVVDAYGIKVAIAESDLEDYPGLWLRGTEGKGLTALHPHYPKTEKLTGDRDYRVTEEENFIAVTKGMRTYPWRVLGIAPHDSDLLTNQLVYLLESPSRLSDTSWIKPGKVSWDWWNANNLAGVDFKAGINTATYKYYVDFAAKNGLHYIILDEGWYKLGNLLEVAPDLNIEELMEYARKKNIGIILWVAWKTLDDQLQPALNQFAKWGARGIKVDFMQRSDQRMINYYEKVCREAAQRKMLVDFHGAVQPAMMTRTWPNLISTEGVRGLEWNKWSVSVTPEHDATLPFTRMFLGPMDYTPGAMHNGNRIGFAPVFDRPMSQGTRCHQLALYVVFESPLQMLADSPTNYEREPEAMEFLSAVPTEWDESKALDGRISDYALLARRRGTDWFLGAITDWDARDLEVDLSFLPAGTYQMTEYRDGINADRNAEDYRKITREVNNTSKFKIHLAEGGGWAARLVPKK